MTVAPQYPLQRSHLGDDNPEELIPSPFGVMERWRTLALQTGELGGLTALRDRVKNDAISALDEIEQRERVVAEREARCDARDRAFKDAVAQFMGRAAPLVDRFSAQRQRADQEREQQEPLAEPPSTTSKLPEPSLPAADDLHANATDLPDLPSKHDPAKDVEPDQGDPEQFVDPELARPPMTHPQPTSAGLDGA
jgi:hypothetical protein